MTSYRKNIFVGATVLLALLFLAVMILLFGEAPIRLLRASQTKIQFVAETAEGISNGSPIYYLGVNVGQVTAFELPAEGAPGVNILGVLRSQTPIPANVTGVRTSSVTATRTL